MANMTHSNLEWMSERLMKECDRLLKLSEWAEKMGKETPRGGAMATNTMSFHIDGALAHLREAIDCVEFEQNFNEQIGYNVPGSKYFRGTTDAELQGEIDDQSAAVSGELDMYARAKLKAEQWAKDINLPQVEAEREAAIDRVGKPKSTCAQDVELKLPAFSQRVYNHICRYLEGCDHGFSDLVAADIAAALKVSEKSVGGALSKLIAEKLIYVVESQVNGQETYNFIYRTES